MKLCLQVFARLADARPVVCVLPAGHLCAHAWGADAVPVPPGTVAWWRPDERPTLRDAEGRVRAVLDAWRP